MTGATVRSTPSPISASPPALQLDGRAGQCWRDGVHVLSIKAPRKHACSTVDDQAILLAIFGERTPWAWSGSCQEAALSVGKILAEARERPKDMKGDVHARSPPRSRGRASERRRH